MNAMLQSFGGYGHSNTGAAARRPGRSNTLRRSEILSPAIAGWRSVETDGARVAAFPPHGSRRGQCPVARYRGLESREIDRTATDVEYFGPMIYRAPASILPSSRRNPSRIVSGCGGHPGMKRSTGSIDVTPSCCSGWPE